MSTLKKIRNRIFRTLHPGKNYYCLFCDKYSGKFIHEGVKAAVFKRYRVAGGGYKINTRCPNCGSPDRARLLALFFDLRTKVLREKSDILHVSPNRDVANYLQKFSSVNQVVGALEPHEFREYDTVAMDIQQIDMPDQRFDVVICCHIIEHVDEDEKAMKELFRVLKPGGFAILQVPLALNLEKTLEDKTLKTDKERKIAFGQVDHVRLYGLDYFTKLQSAGFRVVRDNPFEDRWLSQTELNKHRLDPIEDVLVCYRDK